MTASSKRRRRSAEEGPTIYKCDQLRRMLELALRNRSKRNANTDPVKFLGNYLPVRTDADGATRLKGEDEENPSSARFHSFCKQLAASLGLRKEDVLERLTQSLLHDEAQLKELCDHLLAASEHYDMAMSLLRDEPRNRPVTIRIGTTNLINMRVLPAVLDAVRQRFRAAYPEGQIRFVQTIMDSDELLFGSQPLVGVDAIVACCLDGQAAKIPAAELAASLPLRCCLLRKRDQDAVDTAQRALPSWEPLRGSDMVALATRRKHFDVPWAEIESITDNLDEVPTLLEAHARVATSDAWTLSYRELMDDVDERTLEALDLPVDPSRQSPLIVALLPRARPVRASKSVARTDAEAGAKKLAALGMLKECLQETFTQKRTIQHEAEQLTRWLSRFGYCYHVSDFAQGRDQVRRMWFSGLAQIECTSNGNLSGTLTISNPHGQPIPIRVFGQPLAYEQGTVWHLQWRSINPHDESGTTNLVVSTQDLMEGDCLIGNWVGRSCWTADRVRPTGGPFLLHTRGDLTAGSLRLLVDQQSEHPVPDLRSLATEMIPMTPGEPDARPSKPR